MHPNSAEMISDYQLRRLDDDLQERRNDILLGSWAGTILAGGTFGVLLFLWELVLPIDLAHHLGSFQEFSLGIAQLFSGSCLGFFIGCLWAGGVAIPISLGTLTVLVSLGTSHTPLWIASSIGAWTAFFCCGGFVWTAIILGQIGATAFAIKVMNLKTQRIFKTSLPSPPRNFGLGKLFRAMTVLCLLLGLVSLIKPGNQLLLDAGYCLLWQGASVCLLTLLIKSRSTRTANCM